MNYELRPLTLAEILDAAFRLVQTEWQTLIGLSLIMQIPVFFIAIAVPQLFDPFAQPLETGEEISEQLAFALVAGLAGIVFFYAILYPFVAAAVTASVGNFYLGRRFDLREAAHAGARSFLRLIAAYFVWGIAYLFAAVAVFGAAALLFGIGGALFGDAIESMGGAGIALAVVLGIAIGGVAFFWILFAAFVSALLPPIVVLERQGVFASVRRAFRLGSTSKGRLVGILFTAGMIVGFPVAGAQMLVGMVPVLGALVWALFQAVGFAFTTAVTVVLYFDLRCRAESYDLELLAEQVEAGPGLGHG